jgi:DNA-binding LacI/PurR family transcriptional regulator
VTSLRSRWGTLTSDGTNAADVVTQWVADGVTAVCAQSDETGFIVLQGSWEANLQCPDDLAGIGVVADSLGAVSVPPLTSVPFLADVIVDVAGRRDDGRPRVPRRSGTEQHRRRT